MIVVSNAPLFSPACTGVVRMGDPKPYDADPRLFVLEYPYPGSGTYASWPVGATQWEAKSAIDDSCLFQVSATKTALEAERNGPMAWLMMTGLF